MDTFAIVPSRGEGFVELARSQKGRVFEKQILEYGDLLYPGVKGGKVKIDDAFADKLITNFTNKVCDIVQVPKAGPNNEHTEDPDRNIGEVIALNKRDGGIYARIDARSEADADKLGKTLLGASAMMHLNYTDTRNGKQVGPTLLHVAVTNRPYVVGLKDYEEVVAASQSGAVDTATETVILTAPNTKEADMPLTLDEYITLGREEHGIDIPALQERASKADDAVALSNKIQEELAGSGLLKLSNGEEVTSDSLIGAVAEAGEKIVSLSARVDELVELSAKDKAEARITSLVKSGHILSKNKDAQLKLLLSNPDLFEELLPEKALIRLSNDGEVERGFEVKDDEHEQTVETEIARLTATPAAKAYIRD